jgi:hypothetical protein
MKGTAGRAEEDAEIGAGKTEMRRSIMSRHIGARLEALNAEMIRRLLIISAPYAHRRGAPSLKVDYRVVDCRSSYDLDAGKARRGLKEARQGRSLARRA